MKQAFVFVRFSTLEQRGGASTDRQLERTTAMAQANGWDIVRTIIGEGESGYTGKHRAEGSQFAAFEAEAKAGVHAGKVLIVERLSRLSRQNAHLSYDLMRALVAGGMTLAVWDGNKVYESIEQIDFMATIEYFLKAQLANEESRAKSDFGKDKWKRRRDAARQGVIVTKNTVPWVTAADGGPFPLGDDRRWIVAQDRALLIKRMFEEADAGDGALRIAKRFNQENIPTWPRYANREPKLWDRKFISRIIANPAVVGDLIMNEEDEDGKPVPSGEPIRGYYPRLIDPDLFERVNATAPDRKATMGGRKSVVANLVSGLVKCSVCKSPMEYVRARAAGTVIVRKGVPQAPLPNETAYLYCREHQRGGECSNGAGVAYVGFERALLDTALHLALDDASFSRTDEVGRLSIQIADRRRDYDAASSKASALWEGYAASQSDMAMKLAMQAEAQAKAIGEDIAALEAEKLKAAGAASSAEHLTRLAEVRAHLNHPDLEVRKTHRLKVAAGLHSVIEWIECTPTKAAKVHFKGSTLLVTIKPGRGRAPATASVLDMVRARDYDDDTPSVQALVKRVKADGKVRG